MNQIQEDKLLINSPSEDFNKMRKMLDEIELNIQHIDPAMQREVYSTILQMIFMTLETSYDAKFIPSFSEITN